jgi:small-conductance mechanosensitive channel
MVSNFFNATLVIEIGWAVGIVLVAFLAAWLIYQFINRAANRFDGSDLLPQILISLARPMLLLMIIQGLFLALGFLSPLQPWRDNLRLANILFAIIVFTHGLARAGYIFMSWYGQSVATRTTTTLDDTFTPLLRRILVLIIYVIGGLVLLDSLGITVTPMLTGLGLSGLAVALALQPTLASFFAGLQVITDQVVSVGDFVELDSGEQGYVVEVGWRSTRIRSTYQNLIVVPNSRLVDSIITNYDNPLQEVAVIVEAGVSYSSDLARVEEIALAVTREVIEELPEAVKNRQPWFGFDTFGDSNINFWVWHYATDYIATFRLKSELIKRLHARFNQEGIEINYPVRKLVYEQASQNTDKQKRGL